MQEKEIVILSLAGQRRLGFKSIPNFCAEVHYNEATEVTRRYHAAWNGRDADALVAAFTEDGRFCNPDTNPGVGGEALAEYIKGLWSAFPDFHIELFNAGEIEPGLVAHHWLVKGTNTGQGVDGSALTGRALTLRGASIIRLDGEKIVSDQCYFDRVAVSEQLAPKE